eukprot:scaffold30376_cov109-Isochrysis_galbana.AAC.2
MRACECKQGDHGCHRGPTALAEYGCEQSFMFVNTSCLVREGVNTPAEECVNGAELKARRRGGAIMAVVSTAHSSQLTRRNKQETRKIGARTGNLACSLDPLACAPLGAWSMQVAAPPSARRSEWARALLLLVPLTTHPALDPI